MGVILMTEYVSRDADSAMKWVSWCQLLTLNCSDFRPVMALCFELQSE